MIAFHPDGTERIFKLLSSDPKNYSDAANEAIRRILEEFEGKSLDSDAPLDLKNIGEHYWDFNDFWMLTINRITSHGNNGGNECVVGETGSSDGLVYHQRIQGRLSQALIAKALLTKYRTC